MSQRDKGLPLYREKTGMAHRQMEFIKRNGEPRVRMGCLISIDRLIRVAKGPFDC